MVYSRKLGATERVYLGLRGVCPPIINHLCWDGTGEFDIPKWKKAVEAASRANGGCCGVVRGFGPFSRIVDKGKLPEIVEIDGSRWDGKSSEDAPKEITVPLDHREGPIAQVVLMHGNPLRVVLRTHHSFMDGRGTVTWAEDIFRVLNDKAPKGSNATIGEHELCATFQKEGRPLAKPEYLPPTGPAMGDDPGVMWRHLQYPGRYPNLMGQVAILLCREAWKHAEGKTRIALPVDLRARQEGLRSCGNLTNLIYIDVNPETTAADFGKDVHRQIQEGRDGMIYGGDKLIKYIPIWLLRKLALDDINAKNKNGRYAASAMITNMGRIPLFSGGGFNCTHAWGIPSPQRNHPVFVGMGYTDTDMTLIYSIPKMLGDQGRLEKLIDNVSSGLVKSEG